jgi:putative sterol carrier protein
MAWEVVIHDGRCTSTDRPAHAKPTVSFELGDVAFPRLITGQTSGMALLLTRRLKVRGDLGFARRIDQLFERAS